MEGGQAPASGWLKQAAAERLDAVCNHPRPEATRLRSSRQRAQILALMALGAGVPGGRGEFRTTEQRLTDRQKKPDSQHERAGKDMAGGWAERAELQRAEQSASQHGDQVVPGDGTGQH
jgi:hypothetical protein